MVRSTRLGTVGLILLTLAPGARAGLREQAIEACHLFLGNIGRASSATDPEADLSRGRSVFAAAAAILENGTGAKLPNDGRRAAIPRKLMDPLIAAFQKEYSDAAVEEGRRGRSASPMPIASGNVGHMRDHLNYYEQFNRDFQRALGVDPKSLKLAVTAHDIGKGFLDEFLDLYAANRTKKDFVKQYVLTHEFHSIANIPKVVKRTLESKDIDPDSERGRKLLFVASLQIMEMIRYHNGVLLSERMAERYPDLDTKQIETILRAWWPENYRRFAEDFKEIGLRTEYGAEPLGAIPAVLNLADRATLASPTAPAKLGKQYYSALGLTVDLIEESMIKPARGNIPLIIAQASQLRPYLLDPTTKIHEFPPVKEAQAHNTRMLALGDRFLEMNQPGTLASLKLPPEELPMTARQRAAGSMKQFLYYKVENEWYRVDGSDPHNAVTQAWDGTRWRSVKEGGHPVDHLMALAIRAGHWQ